MPRAEAQPRGRHRSNLALMANSNPLLPPHTSSCVSWVMHRTLQQFKNTRREVTKVAPKSHLRAINIIKPSPCSLHKVKVRARGRGVVVYLSHLSLSAGSRPAGSTLSTPGSLLSFVHEKYLTSECHHEQYHTPKQNKSIRSVF